MDIFDDAVVKKISMSANGKRFGFDNKLGRYREKTVLVYDEENSRALRVEGVTSILKEKTSTAFYHRGGEIPFRMSANAFGIMKFYEVKKK